MKLLTITIPLTPPSVNHYVKHTRQGRHYVTPEGKSFKDAVAIFARGQQVEAKSYRLDAKIFLGAKQRGDGDNFWKCVADGLVEARVIHSDAAVRIWHLELDRDRKNPRTEITIQSLDREN